MNLFKTIAELPFIRKYVSEAPSNPMSEYKSPFYSPTQMSPYNPDDLVQKKGLDIYRKMMIDDQVKAVMAMKINAVLSPGWKIEPASEDQADVEIADFIRHNLEEQLQGELKKALTNILSALIYGFSVTEKIYAMIEAGEYAGKIGLRYLKTRPAHSFDLYTNDYNDLIKLSQNTNKKTIDFEGKDLKYFIVYTYHADNSDFENWYGVSDLRSAYRPWFAKDMNIRFLNIYSERFGMGIFHTKYERGLGTKEQQDLRDIANNLSSKSSIVTPKGIDFEILEGKRSGQAQYIEVIKMYDTAIARSVLVPNMLGFTDISSGTYNLGEKHFDLFMMILENIQGELSGIINEQIIKDLVNLNYANIQDFPYFVFNPLTADDRKELAKIFITAVEKGTVLATEDDESYLRESLNFPKRTKESVLLPEKKVASPLGPGMPPEGMDQPAVAPKKDAKAIPAKAAPDVNAEEDDQNKEFTRKPNSIEKKVNFDKVRKDLDGKEYENALELGKLVTKIKDELINTVVRRKIVEDKDFKEVDRLDLKYLGDMRLLWKDILRKAFMDGKRQAKDLMPKNYAKAPGLGNLPPKEAMAFFERKAFWLTGTERDYILNKAKALLYDGIKSGMTTEQVIYNLEDFFQQYEVLQRDNTGKLQPIEDIEGRLNTVVRTNYMDAYNQGNLTMFQEAKDIIAAYEYSAILDDRTTEICDGLDGLIFKSNNPIWSKITPPNHFNCRSLLIPVFNDEWDGEESDPPTIWPDKGFGG